MRELSSLERQHLMMNVIRALIMLRRFQSIRICCVAVCMLFVAAQGSPALAQANASPDEAWHFQYDLFQLLLEERGLATQNDLSQALNDPRGSVLVILGRTDLYSAVIWERLHSFIRAGGSVLIARDHRSAVPGVGRFMKGPVIAADPANRYHDFDDCVRITDINNWESKFSGVSTIVTNRSSWFLPVTDELLSWEVIARFPQRCLPEESNNQPLLAVGRPLAVSRSGVDTGTIVVAADASLFTNGMLWHGDNAVLAIRVSGLLCTTGKRRLVFVTEGRPLNSARDRLPMPTPPPDPNVNVPPIPPKPTLEDLLRLGNAVAKEVEVSNVLNKTLQQQPRNISPWRYFRALSLVLSALVTLWVVWQFLSNNSKALRPILLSRRRMKSAHEMKVSAATSSDYRQSAGYLAREFCRELTGSNSSADWQKYLARLLTTTPAADGCDRSELTKVIDIASRGCHEAMTSSDFQQLGKTIAALRSKVDQLKLQC